MQTLNNKALALALLLSTLVLGGCSSMPSMTSVFGDDKAEAPVNDGDEGVTDAVNAEGSEAGAVEALTPEQLAQQALAQKAQALSASIDGFKVDKQSQKRLNSSQLSNIQSAISALSNQDYDTALNDVQRVIDDPDFVASPRSEVWVLRGDIHNAKRKSADVSKTNATELVISDYQAAVGISNNNYQAHNRLGQVYRDQGDFTQAKSHYDQAIDAWPGNASSYRNRGILFDLYMGDKQAALADYEIYKALLDLKVESVSASLAEGEKPPKSLMREQRLAGQWITDISRQIKAIERQAAQANAAQSNNSGQE